MSDTSMVYVATAPCGCVHGIDCGEGLSTSEQVAEWIADGSTVDRRPLGEAKVLLADCQYFPKWGRQ